MKKQLLPLMIGSLTAGVLFPSFANAVDFDFLTTPTQYEISFKSHHGHWMRNEDNGGLGKAVFADRSSIGSHEKMFLLSKNDPNCIKNGHTVAVKSGSGWWWTVEDIDWLPFKEDWDLKVWTRIYNHLDEGFRYTLINHSDSSGCLENGDKISFRSNKVNKYIKVESNRNVRVDASNIGSWEKFSIQIHKHPHQFQHWFEQFGNLAGGTVNWLLGAGEVVVNLPGATIQLLDQHITPITNSVFGGLHNLTENTLNGIAHVVGALGHLGNSQLTNVLNFLDDVGGIALNLPAHLLQGLAANLNAATDFFVNTGIPFTAETLEWFLDNMAGLAGGTIDLLSGVGAAVLSLPGATIQLLNDNIVPIANSVFGGLHGLSVNTLNGIAHVVGALGHLGNTQLTNVLNFLHSVGGIALNLPVGLLEGLADHLNAAIEFFIDNNIPFTAQALQWFIDNINHPLACVDTMVQAKLAGSGSFEGVISMDSALLNGSNADIEARVRIKNNCLTKLNDWELNWSLNTPTEKVSSGSLDVGTLQKGSNVYINLPTNALNNAAKLGMHTIKVNGFNKWFSSDGNGFVSYPGGKACVNLSKRLVFGNSYTQNTTPDSDSDRIPLLGTPSTFKDFSYLWTLENCGSEKITSVTLHDTNAPKDKFTQDGFNGLEPGKSFTTKAIATSTLDVGEDAANIYNAVNGTHFTGSCVGNIYSVSSVKATTTSGATAKSTASVNAECKTFHPGDDSTDTDVNIAQGKTATQSSTAHGGAASRAVDGDTNGHYSDGSVTHTGNEHRPWWSVNLNGPKTISGITLWNRSDCCTQRLSNFEVLISTEMGPISLDYSGTTVDEKLDIPFNFDGVYSIEVRLKGTGILSLAEVQVWGQETN